VEEEVRRVMKIVKSTVDECELRARAREVKRSQLMNEIMERYYYLREEIESYYHASCGGCRWWNGFDCTDPDPRCREAPMDDWEKEMIQKKLEKLEKYREDAENAVRG
jgi:hypothetical protein